MDNVIKIDKHMAIITIDSDIEMFRGEFIGLNGGTESYAHSEDKLNKEGVNSLSIFLDECKKDGIAPYKPKKFFEI